MDLAHASANVCQLICWKAQRLAFLEKSIRNLEGERSAPKEMGMSFWSLFYLRRLSIFYFMSCLFFHKPFIFDLNLFWMGFECLSPKLLSSRSMIRLIFWARSELLVRATVAEEQLKQLQKHLKETQLLCIYVFLCFFFSIYHVQTEEIEVNFLFHAEGDD